MMEFSEFVLQRAYRLGKDIRREWRHGKGVDLDEGVPLDIYQVFERVTYRDYERGCRSDELMILRIADAFEQGVAAVRV